jgi:hypothetical protein
MMESMTRRELFALCIVGMACVSAASRARGAGVLPATRLDPKDPAAVKLAYVEDAARVDAKSQPKFIAGSRCENCLLLQGKPGDEYRPCTLFPGKLVKLSGWCAGWAAEM